MKRLLSLFVDALLSLSVTNAKKYARELASLDPSADLIDSLLVPALERIGKGWEEGTVSLSQVYMSGRICEEIVDEMLAVEPASQASTTPVAVAALEDFHKLGKRILHSILRSYGVSMMDFGRVTVDEAVARVAENNVRILLLSTLMLPSALKVRKLRDKLREENLAVKVIVGGAPFRFDPNLWREVGADATAATASEGAGIVLELLKGLS